MSGLLVKRSLELILTNSIPRIPENPVLLWGQRSNPLHECDLPTLQNDVTQVIHVKVNGTNYEVADASGKTLLQMLRDDLRLMGSKEGCAEGECGACTVFMDGAAVLACLVPAGRADGAEVTTIEGIADGEKLSAVQEAFIDEGAIQCGFCTPGFIMSATKLLQEKEQPTIDEIKMAISGNLCRCTGYYKIIKAIEKAVEE